MTDEELRALLAAATPGPWPMEPTGDYKRILVGIGLVDGPHGYDVAEVYSDDCDRNEADANARLIAAAPDLAAEVLRLRAKEAAGDKLAKASAELVKQAKNAGRLGAVTGPHWTNLALAQMQAAASIAAWEAAHDPA